MPSIRYERLSLGDLTPYPGNARQGNVKVIRESLAHHGQYRPIVVQESTGYVLAGNHTVKAAEELGWTEVDAGIIDVDDDQARRIVLVDNRSNDLAVYDDRALADLLEELPDFDGTGFDADAVQALIASMGPGGFTQAELERVIKAPENPMTMPGDVIELGPHRLHCTDALEAVDRFDDVDMIWTDPPYLIGYQVGLTEQEARETHRRTDGKEVVNEHLNYDEAQRFRYMTALLISESLRPGGAFYLHMPPGPDQAEWIGEMQRGAHLRCAQVLQWIKDQFVFGRSDYHYRSEPILYGWKEGASHRWFGDRSQDTVWEIPRPKRSKDHPTMKPVELAIRAIENSSQRGELVFDPFAGSGTALAACMQTGRRFAGVELDPAYCDVIVERFERLSGEQAVRQSG